MAERKGILKAALKALLAGAEVSAPLKIIVTFISELASLSEESRKTLETTSDDQLGEVLKQLRLMASDAEVAAVDIKQIKKMVANSYKLTKKQLAALTTLTQKELKEISDKLDGIDVTTKDTNREVKEIKAIVDKLAKDQLINPEKGGGRLAPLPLI